MMKATIGLIKTDGSMQLVWNTPNHRSRSAREMVVAALGKHSITQPGVYAVCYTNANGVPATKLYTLSKEDGKWQIHPGILYKAPRINRWPPLDAKS